MYTKLFCRLIIMGFLFSVYAHCAQEMAQNVPSQNPFNLITDDCIKIIAGNLDAGARSHLRACDRRLSIAVWPSEKVFHIKIAKKSTESEYDYWPKVLKKLRLLNQCIQRVKARNDIILHLPETCVGFFLHEELPSLKNLSGLFMEYALEASDFCRQTQMANHKKVLEMLPNLKHISLPWRYSAPLASTLDQFKKLQSLQVKLSKLTDEDFASISPTIIELRLRASTILGIPAMKRFTSLRFLSLVQTDFDELDEPNIEDGLEKLSVHLHTFLKSSI